MQGRLLNSPDSMFLYPLMVTLHSFFSSCPPCKVNLLNSTSTRKSIKHERVILAASMRHVQYTYVQCRLWWLTFELTLLCKTHLKNSAKKTRSCKCKDKGDDIPWTERVNEDLSAVKTWKYALSFIVFYLSTWFRLALIPIYQRAYK